MSPEEQQRNEQFIAAKLARGTGAQQANREARAKARVEKMKQQRLTETLAGSDGPQTATTRWFLGELRTARDAALSRSKTKRVRAQEAKRAAREAAEAANL